MDRESKAIMIGAAIGAAAMIALAGPLAMIAVKLQVVKELQAAKEHPEQVRKNLCPAAIRAKVLRDALYRETEADAELVCFYENQAVDLK